jgi:hypothetical protein
MKRCAFVGIALAVAGLALTAGGRLAAAGPQAPTVVAPTVVVVDPNEFRQPVPDPQGGLTQKYHGRLVRFNGVLTGFSQNKKTKQTTYTVSYDFLQTARQGKTVKVVAKQTLNVTVIFQQDPKQLRQQLKTQKKGVPLTVQGNAEVGTDGSLSIVNAVVVPVRGFAK